MSKLDWSQRRIREKMSFFRCLADGTTTPPNDSEMAEVACPSCDGSGHRTCSQCKGDRRIPCNCVSCGNTHYNACSKCLGTPPECKRCHGSGAVKRAFPKYIPHPADEWTLAALKKISINGSFT